MNCGKFLKREEYTLPASGETFRQVKKQQLEPDMEQSGSKLGKEYVRAVYCLSAYITYMQSTSCEMLDWMKLKLESGLPGEISITSGMQMDTTLMAKSEEELESLLVKVTEESEKAGLKPSIKNMKIMASSPITSWQIDGGEMETVTDFIFLGSEITANSDFNHDIKTLAPWKKSYDNPRQCIKKQRHHFAVKGLSSQSYAFFNSHVWM